MILFAYKQLGETMGRCMDRIRLEASFSPEIPITYAGRLDPMAEGLVLFLVGEIRHKKADFLGISKQYQVQFLFGVSTDTYDVLGIPNQDSFVISDISIGQVQKILNQQKNITQSFPPYSSRRVSGKPLFMHAREQQEIPEISRQVTLLQGWLQGKGLVYTKDVFQEKITIMKNIVGDFRQDQIIDHWKSILPTFPEQVSLFSATLEVSSGFYVRSWVHELGNTLLVPSVTFSLLRDKIGVFTLSMLNNKSYRIFEDTDPFIVSFLSQDK